MQGARAGNQNPPWCCGGTAEGQLQQQRGAGSLTARRTEAPGARMLPELRGGEVGARGGCSSRQLGKGVEKQDVTLGNVPAPPEGWAAGRRMAPTLFAFTFSWAVLSSGRRR